MGRYLIRRILLMAPTLLIVTFLVFVLLFLSPGDPVLMLVPVDEVAQMTDEEMNHLRQKLGLDRPIYVQYADWLVHGLQGDLGRSIHQRRAVVDLLAARFPVTLELALLSVFLATIVAIPIGIYTAVRPGGIGDFVGNIAALMGVSAPNFWVALLLIVVFAVHLRWLPAGGFVRMSDDPVGHIERMILPVFTLSTALMAVTMRLTRSSMLEVLNEDYVRTARSKGLGQRRIVFVHALKNALIPVVTTVGLQIGRILGGTIVIEIIFSFPGMGKLLLDAIFGRDFPVVQGSVLLITLAFMGINLLVDLTYASIDPRIRYAS
ncbi:MAG: ABC transporter permease [Chloroflexi bacterium]|nr:ABC transporter permease [Chloroflexota bacterium]